MLPLHISAKERLPAHAHACHYMRKAVLHLPHSRPPESAHKRLLQKSLTPWFAAALSSGGAPALADMSASWPAGKASRVA